MSVIYPVVAHRGYSTPTNTHMAAGPATPAEEWMLAKDAPAARPVRRINANQLTSLSAMISYTAAQSGRSEFRIERLLSDRFNIPNAKCLPAGQFDGAIRYLVDVLLV